MSEFFSSNREVAFQEVKDRLYGQLKFVQNSKAVLVTDFIEYMRYTNDSADTIHTMAVGVDAAEEVFRMEEEFLRNLLDDMEKS
jgi:hypothetical protein